MGTARRPGRVQKIAYDATPMSTGRPDIDARIGWLLAMSRLHHRDPAMGDGRRFVQALADAGSSASRSLVSRWESGEIPVSYEGLLAYEQVLGLTPGELTSLAGYLRVAVPPTRDRVARPHLDPTNPAFAERLDELLDGVEDGHATPHDWQELGWHMAAAPLVHLRARSWETLAHRLVNQLPRTVKVPRRQVASAAMNIGAIPRAQEFLTDAIADYIAQPGVQVISQPVVFLDRLPTRGAAKMTLDLIEQEPTPGVFALAVWVATKKIQHGHFTPEERARLDMIVLQMWRRDPVSASERLAELVASLPEGLRQTLTSAASKAGRSRLEYAVEMGEDFGPATARSLPRDLAAAARARVPQRPTYEDDRMLPRLVRESLFHRDSERRHLAALVLAASPFGDALADELLTLLAAPGCPVQVRSRAAMVMRAVCNDVHRLRMLRCLDDPQDDVGSYVVQGVGHLSFTHLSDQMLRTSLRGEFSTLERSKLYALGMSGSPGLAAISRSDGAPPWQRTAARWWLAQGSAILE